MLPLCAGLLTPHGLRPQVSRFEVCLETSGRSFRRGQETRAERGLRLKRSVLFLHSVGCVRMSDARRTGQAEEET
jgi:hypothetical protein